MYIIERRYQAYKENGLDWSNWFTLYDKTFDSLKEAEVELKALKKSPEMNKKLKGEYRISQR